jgi:hypothetical protein
VNDLGEDFTSTLPATIPLAKPGCDSEGEHATNDQCGQQTQHGGKAGATDVRGPQDR